MKRTVAIPSGMSGAPASPSSPVQDVPLPLTIMRWRGGDTEVEMGGGGTVCVIMMLSDGQLVDRLRAGTWSSRQSGFGLVTVTDPGEIIRYRIPGALDIVKLFLPLKDLVAASAPGQGSPVRARFNDVDPLLERCAHRALVALHDGDGADPLLLSSIAYRLARRLTEASQADLGRAMGGLSSRQARCVREFIDARLFGPTAASPSLGELAAHANLSLHHFIREFRRTFGTTPYRHMLRLRLERARSLLVRSDLPVADVGRSTGFASPAHFTDRFRREIGVSPSAFRRATRN